MKYFRFTQHLFSFCTEFIFNLHNIYFHFAQKPTFVFGLDLFGFKQKRRLLDY